MSSAWPREAQPRTIVVAGTGAPEATWIVPDGVQVDLESVVASIDAAGGAVRPRLVIQDQTGVVIAEKRQAAELPGGSSDTATWALRLSDEAAGVAASHAIGFYDVEVRAPVPAPDTRNDFGGAPSSLLEFTFAGAGSGVDLLDTVTVGTPSGPSVKTAGLYALRLTIGFVTGAFGQFPPGSPGDVSLLTQNEPPPENAWSQQAWWRVDLGVTNRLTLGWVRYLDPAGATGAQYFQAFVKWPAGNSIRSGGGDLSVQRIY